MIDVPSTVAEAAARLRARELSSVELTSACLRRADELDARLGTYLTRFDAAAMEAAAQADHDLAVGVDRGPLHGIPVGIKDIVAVAEGPTTANSVVHDPAWGAGHDAPVVRRLKDAGAVITGKVVLSEFAIGAPDPTKPFPIPRNPWNLAATPGGSSSGTANGVSAGLFLAGIGTDTGGSIRLPAAFCGVSGLKPTFGRVPKSGVVPLAYTLDHVGPLARSAWDCAAVLDVIAGHDPTDPTSSDRPTQALAASLRDGMGLEGVRIGVPIQLRDRPGADPDILGAFEAAILDLAALGAMITDVDLPHYEEVAAASRLTLSCEAMAYHRPDLIERWADYHPRTRSTVGLGALISGADYVQAQRVRRLGQRALADLFGGIDLIATPTATVPAPAQVDANGPGTPLADVSGHIHTVYWDAVGNPVLAVPIGFTRHGLPAGMQLAGRPFDELAVLAAGHAFQQVTDWHRRLPGVGAGPLGDDSTASGTPVADPEQTAVRMLLARAGLDPPPAGVVDLARRDEVVRTLIERVHSVALARHETPCLSFEAVVRDEPWGPGR